MHRLPNKGSKQKDHFVEVYGICSNIVALAADREIIEVGLLLRISFHIQSECTGHIR